MQVSCNFAVPAVPVGVGAPAASSSLATLQREQVAPSVRATQHVQRSGQASLALATAAAASVAALGSARASAQRRAAARRRTSRVVAAQGPVVAHESMCLETEDPKGIRRRFEAVIAEAQEKICDAIAKVDGKATFSREPYTRESGGGGIARVLKDGAVFEKAGVNLSVVYGQMPQEALRAATERGVDRVGGELKPGEKVPFFACGLSSVMHPKNPFCPTMHFNYRFFETGTGVWWFGGGTDITPSYINEDDMKHFHGTYKDVCDKHNPEWYPKFKKWADEYFQIKHRGETRGLGGIFFDDFNSESQDEHLAFSADCLDAVTKAYVPLLEKHRDDEFTAEQKAWQQMRRGRYVEFNLIYDRGTVFGLKMLSSGVGRLESILMSLPETARWEYDHAPAPGTPETEIMDAFKNPRDWA